MFKAPPTVLSATEFLQKLRNELSNKPAKFSALRKEFQVWFDLYMYIIKSKVKSNDKKIKKCNNCN